MHLIQCFVQVLLGGSHDGVVAILEVLLDGGHLGFKVHLQAQKKASVVRRPFQQDILIWIQDYGKGVDKFFSRHSPDWRVVKNFNSPNWIYNNLESREEEFSKRGKEHHETGEYIFIFTRQA
jgi:hypothetical protein